MKRLKLALISSYNEACANAAYAASLKNALEQNFDVTLFDLKTNELLRPPGRDNVRRADEHIDWICSQLPSFDIVNVHGELGLYGHSLEQIERRIPQLCDASMNLIYTLHSISTENNDFTKTYAHMFNILRSRPASRPYHIITHIGRDKDLAMKEHGIPTANITDFPVLFLNEQQRAHYIGTANPKAWKIKNGFKEDDIIIGRYGFFSGYKEYISGLKALTLLPPHYKMAFVGGQIPHTIEKMKIHPIIKEMTDFIDEYDAKEKQLPSYVPGKTPLLADRVAYFGAVSDDALYQAVANIDIALIAYYEAGQSASAITSLALELHRPCLLSYNFTFMEYEKYFPNCFEFFNIGNHHEIRHKVLNFDFSKVDNIKNYTSRYTLAKLVEFYETTHNSMRLAAANAPVETVTEVSAKPKRHSIGLAAQTQRYIENTIPTRRVKWIVGRVAYYAFRPQALVKRLRQSA